MCIICGDCNINLLNSNHASSSNFTSMLLSENMIPQIILLTRITENSMTLIDNILVRMDINNIDTWCISGNLISWITDHLPNFLLYDNTTNQQENGSKRAFFADDTNFFSVNKDLHQLKHDAEKLLSKLCDWFAGNKLTLKKRQNKL